MLFADLKGSIARIGVRSCIHTFPSWLHRRERPSTKARCRIARPDPGSGLALLLLILSSPILGALLVAAETSVTTVVTGGTFIDGTGRDPLADSAILIRDGRVDAVTTSGVTSIPADAQRIDARGKWIIPGLIDMHVDYRPDWMDDLFLRPGVTAVRDVGNGLEGILELRQRSRESGTTQPRLFTGGPLNRNRVRLGHAL